MAEPSLSTEQPVESQPGRKNRSYPTTYVWRTLRRNPPLAWGLLLLTSLLLFAVVGAGVYDLRKAAPLSGPPAREPSATFPLGTDQQGRDMLAAIIFGTPLILRIGLIAAIFGTNIGTMLSFLHGHFCA